MEENIVPESAISKKYKYNYHDISTNKSFYPLDLSNRFSKTLNYIYNIKERKTRLII